MYFAEHLEQNGFFGDIFRVIFQDVIFQIGGLRSQIYIMRDFHLQFFSTKPSRGIIPLLMIG